MGRLHIVLGLALLCFSMPFLYDYIQKRSESKEWRYKSHSWVLADFSLKNIEETRLCQTGFENTKICDPDNLLTRTEIISIKQSIDQAKQRNLKMSCGKNKTKTDIGIMVMKERDASYHVHGTFPPCFRCNHAFATEIRRMWKLGTGDCGDGILLMVTTQQNKQYISINGYRIRTNKVKIDVSTGEAFSLYQEQNIIRNMNNLQPSLSHGNNASEIQHSLQSGILAVMWTPRIIATSQRKIFRFLRQAVDLGLGFGKNLLYFAWICVLVHISLRLAEVTIFRNEMKRRSEEKFREKFIAVYSFLHAASPGKIENKFNQSECGICLDNIQDTLNYGSIDSAVLDQNSENRLFELNCGHLFHAYCLANYLAYGDSDECPICKSYIQVSGLAEGRNQESFDRLTVQGAALAIAAFDVNQSNN